MLRILLRLLLNLLRLPFAPIFWLARLARRGPPWVRLRLGRRVSLLAPAEGWLRRLLPRPAEPPHTSLLGVEALVRSLGSDRRVRGLWLDVGRLSAGWGVLAALRAELVRLRAQGKEIVAHLPEGGGMRELYVASAADRVVCSPMASFELSGIGTTSRYLAGALEKFGLRVEPFARGRYKTAAESLSDERMSEPQREQLDALLSAFDDALRAALVERAALDDAAVAGLFEAALVSAEAAQRAGLVDALAYEDELPSALELPSKRAFEPAEAYLTRAQARLFRPLRRPRHVAVVEVHGAISRSGRGASQRRLVGELRRAARDRRAVAIVLDIDSPGGSALASDLIHREVTRAAAKKPVVAYFGGVAASGGYYIAAGAHEIVAAETTITGSIGVISARLDASRLLERLGVRTETVLKAPHADLLDPARPSTVAERALVQRELEVAYQGFLRRVAEGRALTVEQVHELAQGRVWSGRDARRHGLVDRVGGLAALRAALAERLSISPAEAERLPMHRPARPRGRRQVTPPPLVETLLREVAHPAADLLSLIRDGERAVYYELDFAGHAGPPPAHARAPLFNAACVDYGAATEVSDD